jgi:hypothetical protein
MEGKDHEAEMESWSSVQTSLFSMPGRYSEKSSSRIYLVERGGEFMCDMFDTL